MNDKVKIGLAGLVVILIAFATGRYTSPTKIETVTKVVTVEVEKVVKDVKKNVVIVEVKKPDGTTTTTTTDQSTSTTVSDKNTNINIEDRKLVESNKDHLIIEGIVGLGLDIRNPTEIVYGAHISKNLLGPIRLGILGLTNSTLGVTVGLQF